MRGAFCASTGAARKGRVASTAREMVLRNGSLVVMVVDTGHVQRECKSVSASVNIFGCVPRSQGTCWLDHCHTVSWHEPRRRRAWNRMSTEPYARNAWTG